MIIFRPHNNYTVAIGATSTRSGVITQGIDTVRLVASVDCFIKFGTNPTADTTTSVFLKAGVPEYFHVPLSGVTQIATLESSVAGTLYVSEMTR